MVATVVYNNVSREGITIAGGTIVEGSATISFSILGLDTLTYVMLLILRKALLFRVCVFFYHTQYTDTSYYVVVVTTSLEMLRATGVFACSFITFYLRLCRFWRNNGPRCGDV